MEWQKNLSNEIRLKARNNDLPISLGVPIYARAYRLRVIESLKEDFPLLTILLGSQFEDLAFSYLDSISANYANLLELGSQFPRFIQKTRRESEVLFEIAQFEWALLMAQNINDPNKLIENISESSQICLSPTTQVFKFNHSWSSSEDSVEIVNNLQLVLISARIEGFVSEVTPQEFLIFNLLKQPIELSRLSESVLDLGLEISIQDFFLKWMALGLFDII